MMPLWLAMGGLSLLFAAFVLWPLWRHRRALSQAKESQLSAEEVAVRLQANVTLFHEHMLELDRALAEGRIATDQYAQLKLEQERALLDDDASLSSTSQRFRVKFGPQGLAAMAFLMVALSVGVYYHLGSSQDLHLHQLQVEKIRLDYEDISNNRAPDPARARALLAVIDARLAQEPDNLRYWFMSARTAMEIPDYGKAVTAYQKVLALDPQAATVMAELAQAMFLRDKHQMSPVIADLALKALEINPDNTMALGLAGINTFQQQDFPATVAYWQKAVNLMGANSAASQALLGGIARAKQQLAQKGQAADLPATGPVSADLDTARKINLKVSIAPGLKIPSDHTVFIYARAWQGSRMPLAIKRLSVAELPVTLTLDESMAMSPASSLATADQVEVVARVSADGSAVAKPGDYQVSLGPLDMNRLPDETPLVIEHQLLTE